MKFQGAVIKQQGVTFAVVIVKQQVLDNPADAQRAIASFTPVFPGVPVVLMAQDMRGTPTYYGNSNIVNFLASVPLQAIPWKEYTLS
jgi:hypothetical protein